MPASLVSIIYIYTWKKIVIKSPLKASKFDTYFMTPTAVL